LSFQTILNEIDTELQQYTPEDEEDVLELTREELCQKYQEAFARQEKLNVERLAARTMTQRQWGTGFTPPNPNLIPSDIQNTNDCTETPPDPYSIAKNMS
jgi:hypothetical protein